MERVVTILRGKIVLKQHAQYSIANPHTAPVFDIS